jgi:hypothetical protein
MLQGYRRSPAAARGPVVDGDAVHPSPVPEGAGVAVTTRSSGVRPTSTSNWLEESGAVRGYPPDIDVQAIGFAVQDLLEIIQRVHAIDGVNHTETMQPRPCSPWPHRSGIAACRRGIAPTRSRSDPMLPTAPLTVASR